MSVLNAVIICIRMRICLATKEGGCRFGGLPVSAALITLGLKLWTPS
ncbi:MAG: hypothetical protein GX874_07665 [Smithella sp.]|nr:hypothetical protein [Smithella sp.]